MHNPAAANRGRSPGALAPRPGRDHGAALAGIAAGLGRRAAEATRPREPPVRLAVPVLRQRFSQQGVVGTRRRARRWNWARCSSRWRRLRKRCCSSAASTTPRPATAASTAAKTGNLLTGALWPGGGEIRSGISMDQLVAQTVGGQTKVPSLVLGCEQSIVGAAQRLLDDLQLAHLVELADDADAAGTLPGPGLRPPVPRRGGPGDKSVLDAVLDEAKALRDQVSHSDRRKLDEYLSSRPRSRAADRPGRQARHDCKAGGPRSTNPTCRGPPTAFRRTSTSTCG